MTLNHLLASNKQVAKRSTFGMVQYSNPYKNGMRVKIATPWWGQTDFQGYTHTHSREPLNHPAVTYSA